jgi:hypothetical protein
MAALAVQTITDSAAVWITPSLSSTEASRVTASVTAVRFRHEDTPFSRARCANDLFHATNAIMMNASLSGSSLRVQ